MARQPESMTRWATSILNSRVNFLLVGGALVTIFPPTERAGLSGVYFLGGVSDRHESG